MMTIEQAVSQYSAEQSGSWPRIARALIAEHASLRDEPALAAAFMAARKAREATDPGTIGWDAAYDREMGAGELLSALWDWQREQPTPATVAPPVAVRLAGMRAKLERACEALAGMANTRVVDITINVDDGDAWNAAAALVGECGGRVFGTAAEAIVRGVLVRFHRDAADPGPVLAEDEIEQRRRGGA